MPATGGPSSRPRRARGCAGRPFRGSPWSAAPSARPDARRPWRCPTSISCCRSGVGLRPDHLDADLALPRTVELREDDGLEPSEGELSVVHAEGDRAALERRAQVRVGVAPLAVREAGVVVAITVALRHQLLDEPLQVVDE